jgi:hypothetical protein
MQGSGCKRRDRLCRKSGRIELFGKRCKVIFFTSSPRTFHIVELRVFTIFWLSDCISGQRFTSWSKVFHHIFVLHHLPKSSNVVLYRELDVINSAGILRSRRFYAGELTLVYCRLDVILCDSLGEFSKRSIFVVM